VVASRLIRKGETSIMIQSGLQSNSQQQSTNRFASTCKSVKSSGRLPLTDALRLC
jgi:hypothetical protein